MKSQRVLLVLTCVNVGILVCQFIPLRRAEAQAAEPQILRCKGLVLVDDQGRDRAQLAVLKPDNKSSEETVILRLITADGKPRVKLSTSENRSGLMLLGASDTTYTILQGEGAQTSLKLRNDESTQKILKP